MQDWIDHFLEVTDGISSPEIFRLWAAISAVAGSMERRLWVTTSLGTLYGNLYIMLVAPPGVGKTVAMIPVEQIWNSQNNINVAPESMTKAALMDTLSEARRIVTLPQNAGILEYHSLQIAVSELGVLISTHDLEFLSILNRVFDNPPVLREKRRYVNGGKEIQIVNPQINIMAGAQPGLLATILPEEAWVMGFTSRFIMVFAGEGPRPDLFGGYVDRSSAYKELTAHMAPWTEFHGQFKWEDSAVSAMRHHYQDEIKPIPESPKLESYKTRRAQFLIKLSMISALSRTSNIIIEEFDVERARHWLLTAEATMPGIFKAMTIKTDAQLIDEMHVYLWREYKAGKFVPLSQGLLTTFLSHRVYSERIPKVIDTAFKARLLEDLGGGMFKPAARLDLGQGILKGI